MKTNEEIYDVILDNVNNLEPYLPDFEIEIGGITKANKEMQKYTKEKDRIEKDRIENDNKFNRIKSLGYIPSDFCMSKNDIINSNHDDRFDYLLEHIYHIDTQYREDCIRVQGFITLQDFYTGLEELEKPYDFYLCYVKGYIRITFILRIY